jgi:hypothetical protein
MKVPFAFQETLILQLFNVNQQNAHVSNECFNSILQVQKLNENINLKKVHFVGLHHITVSRCTVQKKCSLMLNMQNKYVNVRT